MVCVCWVSLCSEIAQLKKSRVGMERKTSSSFNLGNYDASQDALPAQRFSRHAAPGLNSFTLALKDPEEGTRF